MRTQQYHVRLNISNRYSYTHDASRSSSSLIPSAG
jgi:hypothetical protein